jgi:hypothetical protein
VVGLQQPSQGGWDEPSRPQAALLEQAVQLQANIYSSLVQAVQWLAG